VRCSLALDHALVTAAGTLSDPRALLGRAKETCPRVWRHMRRHRARL